MCVYGVTVACDVIANAHAAPVLVAAFPSHAPIFITVCSHLKCIPEEAHVWDEQYAAAIYFTAHCSC